jgi:hypothetical protein
MLAIPASALAATPVTACSTELTDPGDYVLTQDVDCAGSVGIGLQGSDITFSLNGHTISNAYFAVYMTAGGSNVHVTGPGTVSHATYGLYMYGDFTNSGFDGFTVTGSTTRGFSAEADQASTGSYLRNVLFTNNANEAVVIFYDGYDVAGNGCSNNTGNGLLIFGSDPSDVHGNTCNDNGGTGINVGSDVGHQIHGNTATGNSGGADGYDSSPDCGSNHWYGNLFVTFNQACVNNEPGAGAGGGGGPVCTITGTAGNDRLRGTSGDDVMCGLGGDDVLDGRGGNDEIYGDDGNDEVIGKGGNDKLYGGDGVDLLLPGAGNDTADGGASVRDRVLYSDIQGGGVNVFLASGAVSPESGSNVGTDQLSNIEQVFGSEFDDILVAQIAGVASTVKGGGGDDHLDTDDGDGLDAMVGNAGSDICAGNPGDRVAEC